MNKDISNMTIEDIYNLLLNRLGYPTENYDNYGKIDGSSIVTYTDVSYHGSPHYIETSRVTMPENMISALKYLLSPDFKEIILNASAEKELISLERKLKDVENERSLLVSDIDRLKIS